MKWITPAWISPALVLAFVPAGIVSGQSTSSSFDGLATGPIAELLPDNGSSSSFRPGVINPKDVIQPPASNPLPGGPKPLPTATSNRSGTTNRSSLINEPVPYNQVPQIQQDIYSLEDTFTLPRTPAVSNEYSQQQPKQYSSAAVNETYSTQMATPVMNQPMQQDFATAPVTTDVCACGSNDLAPENCQCDSCQGRFPQIEFAEDCSTCEQIVQEGFAACDSCETVVGDCGCDTCGEMDYVDCEVVGGPDSYFQTQEGRFANEDIGDRDIKLGPIARVFRRKRQRHQDIRFAGDDRGYSDRNFDGRDAAYNDSYRDVGQSNQGNNVYQPAVGDLTNPNDTHTNTLFSVSGVFLNRNTPDAFLSTERVPVGVAPTRFLRSSDVDFGSIGGVDASLTRRRASGKGFELRYLSLTPGESTRTFAGNPVTLVRDFAQIGQIGGINHEQAYNLAEVHEVSRDMSLQNAEFNLLRMGRTASTRRGNQAIFEYLLGFRYLKFDETLSYSAYGIRPNRFVGGDITRANYTSEVENELYGAQFGGRSEISLFNRLGLLVGLKAGIFQNNFSGSQNASVTGFGGEKRVAQVLTDPNQGTPFNFSGEDEDYTLLGEIDLGLTYRLTNSVRLRGGYKGIFVDDIAFADTQGSSNFNDIVANSTPTANDDLVLHGGYFGLDFAF